MGTQTLGNATPPANNNQFFYESTVNGVAFKAIGNSATTPGELYIDEIDVYCGTKLGGSAQFIMAIYGTGGSLLGQTDVNFSYGTGFAFNHCSFSAGNYLHLVAGQNVVGAAYSIGQGMQTAGLGDGGTFAAHLGTGLPSPWSATSTPSTLGNMPWYAKYFPKATITSLTSTAVFPGQTFTVNGLSFTAGVLSVKVNGVTCSGVSVVNDTQLTATVPAGATTGPVVVATNAGTATSPGSLVIAGGRIFHSSALVSAQSVRVYHSSALTQIVSIRTAKNVSGSLVLTDVH